MTAAAVPSYSARPATPDVEHPLVMPKDPIASPQGRLHGAVFSRRWPSTSVGLLSVHGDIDATNAAAMTEYALAEVMPCQGLVLDLRGLGFCGTEGFVALHRISVCYAAAGKAWTIVSGPAVSRLLGMCDPAGALPHASTMKVALTSIQHQRRITHTGGVPT